jgi:hypothetical protein
MTQSAEIEAVQLEIERILTIIRNAITIDHLPRNIAGEPLPLTMNRYVSFDSAYGDATPMIQWDGANYHLVVEERGSEYERSIGDMNTTLRHLFSGVTFNLASNYEVHHRVEPYTPRAIHAEQLRLLALLDTAWIDAENARLAEQLPPQ